MNPYFQIDSWNGKYEIFALYPFNKEFVAFTINEGNVLWDNSNFLRKLHKRMKKSIKTNNYNKFLRMTDYLIPIEDIAELLEMFNLLVKLKAL